MNIFPYCSIDTEMFKKYFFITSPLKEGEIVDHREDIIGSCKIVKFTKEKDNLIKTDHYYFAVSLFADRDQNNLIVFSSDKLTEKSRLFKRVTTKGTVEKYLVKQCMKKLKRFIEANPSLC